MSNEKVLESGKQKMSKPTFLQVIISTLAAAIGIQNSKNHNRDSEYGSVKTYIAAGIIFTIIFVLTISFIVKMVLKSMGV